jgi:predicted Zn-dependent protease
LRPRRSRVRLQTVLLARLLVVAVAVSAIAVLVPRLADHDACQTARSSITSAAFSGHAPAGAQLDRLVGRCRDTDVLAGVSGALSAAGRMAQAAHLARTAVRREPDAFLGWVALAQALRARDPRGAAAALARARRLNPRLRVPAPATSPTSPAVGGGHRP